MSKIIIEIPELDRIATALETITNKGIEGCSCQTKTNEPIKYATPISETKDSPQVPVAEPTYTIDQLAVAAGVLTNQGPQMQGKLKDLLTQFNIERIPNLPKNEINAFAVALRALGAEI